MKKYLIPIACIALVAVLLCANVLVRRRSASSGSEPVFSESSFAPFQENESLVKGTVRLSDTVCTHGRVVSQLDTAAIKTSTGENRGREVSASGEFTSVAQQDTLHVLELIDGGKTCLRALVLGDTATISVDTTALSLLRTTDTSDPATTHLTTMPAYSEYLAWLKKNLTEKTLDDIRADAALGPELERMTALIDQQWSIALQTEDTYVLPEARMDTVPDGL